MQVSGCEYISFTENYVPRLQIKIRTRINDNTNQSTIKKKLITILYPKTIRLFTFSSMMKAARLVVIFNGSFLYADIHATTITEITAFTKHHAKNGEMREMSHLSKAQIQASQYFICTFVQKKGGKVINAINMTLLSWRLPRMRTNRKDTLRNIMSESDKKSFQGRLNRLIFLLENLAEDYVPFPAIVLEYFEETKLCFYQGAFVASILMASATYEELLRQIYRDSGNIEKANTFGLANLFPKLLRMA